MSVVEEFRRRAETLVYQRPFLREAYSTIQGVVAQGPILRRVRDTVNRIRKRIGERIRERVGR